VAQVEAVGLNEEEMTLVIKHFKTTLNGCKEYPNKNKSKGKRSCFKCGMSGHFIAQSPSNENDQGQEKKWKKQKKKNYMKAKGEAHIGKELDSDCSSSDSDDEGLAASAFDKSSLFPYEHHTCLMAKEKKVRTRYTHKYTSSSDEESDDNDVDYSDLFNGLDRYKVDKINELTDALNEKDRLLDKQDDILYKEHDKLVNAEKSLALEVKRNELLSSEVSSCNDAISSLKSLNADLNAKLEKLNITSSSMEHVSICNRCKDFDIDAFNAHASMILKLNNDIASLNAQLKTCKNENDKIKFARDAYTIGRHPFIKDGLGFQKETKNLTSQRTSNLNKEKRKALMASSLFLLMVERIMLICMPMLRMPLTLLIMMVVIVMLFYLYVMMLLLILMPCLHHLPLLTLMVGIDLGTMFIMLLLMRLGMHQMDQPCFIKLMMLHLFLCAKMIK
jgi:hypothetical protein